MSFGITKDLLLASLSKVRKSICYYMGTTFDCKYMASEETKLGSCECSGCPELYQAIDIINAMTTEEFDTIRKRAKIVISEIDLKDNS